MGWLDSAINSKNVGSQSLRKTVNSAIKNTGSTPVLSDNREVVLKAVKKYEKAVANGNFRPADRSQALGEIKNTLNLKSSEVTSLKRVLRHIGEKPFVSHTRMRRADEGNLGTPHFAGQIKLANNSGLSGVASPNLDRLANQSAASVSQLLNSKNKLSGNMMDVVGRSSLGGTKPLNRPPMIPFSK